MAPAAESQPPTPVARLRIPPPPPPTRLRRSRTFQAIPLHRQRRPRPLPPRPAAHHMRPRQHKPASRPNATNTRGPRAGTRAPSSHRGTMSRRTTCTRGTPHWGPVGTIATRTSGPIITIAWALLSRCLSVRSLFCFGFGFGLCWISATRRTSFSTVLASSIQPDDRSNLIQPHLLNYTYLPTLKHTINYPYPYPYPYPYT